MTPVGDLHLLAKRLRDLQRRHPVELHERVELRAWTSLRVGGPADLMVRCTTLGALSAVVDVLHREGASFFVLGGGTNVVAPDAGLRIPVLTLGGELAGLEVDLDGVVAGGGANLTQVCRSVARAGLSGMEGLFGIPGTFGGALAMNAGAAGVEICELLDWVEVYRPGEGPVLLGRDEVEAGYRWSSLAEDGAVIARGRLALLPGELADIMGRMREVSASRAGRFPGGPSAGSVFKNPPGDHAGRLLEATGCKGLRVGGARVSQEHANIVVTDRGAAAADVLELARLMQRRVRECSGIVLEPEVLFLDEMGRRIALP